MFSKLYSPHILVYKPQVNSIFSLFLRFILIVAFLDYIFFSFGLSFLSTFIYGYFLDLAYVTEVMVVFYILSVMAEDFVDYDNLDIYYLDIDLIKFFKFLSNFFILLAFISITFFALKITS